MAPSCSETQAANRGNGCSCDRFAVGITAGIRFPVYRLTVLLIAALVMGLAVTHASAQQVMESLGDWEFEADPPPFETRDLFGTAEGNGTAAFLDTDKAVGHVRLWGAADDDDFDFFNITIPIGQSFRLAEDAVVHIPTYLVGKLAFAAGSGHNANLQVRGTVEVLRELDGSGGRVGPLEAVDVEQFGGPNAGVDRFIMPTRQLEAGDYRLVIALNINGNADTFGGMSGPGSAIHAVFHPDGTSHSTLADLLGTPRHGMAASVFALPDEPLGNSRAAVHAPTARATHGVDGSGVKVGVMETGIAHEHQSLAGRLLAPLLSGEDAEAFRSEHALAVTGIIGSAHADSGRAGVAPGVSVRNVAFGPLPGATNADKYTHAFTELHGDGIRIVNMSSNFPSANPDTNKALDRFVNDQPDMTLVNSSGNTGGAAGAPTGAYNIITVGSVNRDFTARSTFSSFSAAGAGMAHVPTLVAPGEYIESPWAVDTDGSGALDNFGRGFLGEAYHRDQRTNTEHIGGTSFAAPHVTGTVALMHQLADDRDHLDDAAYDHRVIKGILVHSATRQGITRSDGTVWSQGFGSFAPPAPAPINRSLDTELGGGLLNAHAALDLLDAGTAITEDVSHAGPKHRVFDITGNDDRFFGSTWELGSIISATDNTTSTVDYLLGDIQGLTFTATLTWDYHVGHDILPHLELLLLREGDDENNLPGFDPNDPLGDAVLAFTSNANENVKFIEMTVPHLGEEVASAFYLQITNRTDLSGFGDFDAVQYGMALTVIPEPGTLALLALGGLMLLLRQRRAGH